MNISRTLFGWSSPHIQPLTPVSEVSEPPESPSPYNLDTGSDFGEQVQQDPTPEEIDELDSPSPPTVPFVKLFVYADGLDWILMSLGSLAAAVHGAALPVFLVYVGKIINLFALYQHDLHMDLQHQLSPASHHSLANEVARHALYIVYIAVAVFAAGWVEVACWLYTAERQSAVLRSQGVKILLQQDLGYFDHFAGNGEFVSQISKDVLSVHDILSEKVDNYIHNMATCIASLTVGFASCWPVALATLCTTPFILAAGIVSNLFLTRLAEHVQETYSEAALIAEQAILYVKTVYAYANETIVKYAYANALQSTLQYGVRISLVQGLGLGCIYGIAMCSCALQMWVGWYLITHHKANAGQIIVALFAIILSGLGLNQAATNFQAFDHGRAAAHRLFDRVMKSKLPTNNSVAADDTLILSDVQGNIELRNVYFSYPSRPDVPVLSGLYLTLPARKTLALAGSNGSGKSSVIALIERFYGPTLGEVLLDGENIRNLNVEWLRSQIGLVSQEPALFEGSVKDNILYGRNATTDEVEEAAKIAHAHTFISSLPDGYNSKVGGEDSLVFTPEKKLRIAIARAVLKNPRILLLDEATSTLEMEAEQSVQEALDILMLGRSTIVIAHRLVSIRGADMIAVLEEGQLVEMGTHDELLRVDGAYADLIRLQDTAKQPRRPPPKTFVPDSRPLSPRSSSAPFSLGKSYVREFQASEQNVLESPPVLASPPVEKPALEAKAEDSFDTTFLQSLPRIDVHHHQQKSHYSNSNPSSTPESPISPLLNSDQDERSHSKTFSRSLSQAYDLHNTNQ